MPVSFDVEEPPARPVRRREPAREEEPGKVAASVYFGSERLKSASRKAESSGLSLSAYICYLVDTSGAVDDKRAERLELLAKLRGVTPAELVDALIDKALG